MNWSIVGIFIASFIFGCVILQFSATEYKTVLVYPTPKTVNQLQYKDSVGTCFQFKAKLVDCKGTLSRVPPQ